MLDSRVYHRALDKEERDEQPVEMEEVPREEEEPRDQGELLHAEPLDIHMDS